MESNQIRVSKETHNKLRTIKAKSYDATIEKLWLDHIALTAMQKAIKQHDEQIQRNIDTLKIQTSEVILKNKQKLTGEHKNTWIDLTMKNRG